MAKKIFGLTGKIAAGKGTVAAYLQKNYGASVYRFSTPLRDALDRFYLDQTRENMQTISRILRENFGQDLLANVIAADVKKDKNKIIVVDGIRRFADIKALKNIPGFYLVYIKADPRLRYERLKKRKENKGDTQKSFAQFLKEDQAESEQEIEKVGAAAQIVLDNNKTFAYLYKQVKNLI